MNDYSPSQCALLLGYTSSSGATPLLEATLTLCFENILKLLYSIPHLHIIYPSRCSYCVGREKNHRGPCLRNTEVAAPVECGVWPTPATQVVPSAQVNCHDTFAMHQTAIFLGFFYNKLHHGDILLIPNKNGLFGLTKYTYSAPSFFTGKSDKHHFCLVLNLVHFLGLW
jgi:hypothetical protein